MAWTKVLPLADCRRDAGTFVRVANLNLGVFILDVGRRAFVIDDTCPHAGGSLSAGEVLVAPLETDAARNGPCVECPYHQWLFNLDDGSCVAGGRGRVRSYPCEIRDAAIWADLP